MIEFMNAVSVPFVAFTLVVLAAPVIGLIAYYAAASGHEERQLKYGLEEHRSNQMHQEKMTNLKELDARAIEHKKR